MSRAASDTVGPGGEIAALWDARIARAKELAAEHAQASEILTFYAGLAGYQQSLLRWRRRASRQPRVTAGFAETVDLDAASAAVPDFLAWLQETAPEPLAATATRGVELEGWRQLMRGRLMQPDADVIGGPGEAGEANDAMTFVVEALLQPFVEAAAIDWRADGHGTPRAPGVRPSRCPVCSGRPGVGILREEGHGAKRTLLCALCLTEWEFLRVVCPACDEQRFDALPVYTADAFPHVRVDACDSCQRYLKTIDLTKHGLAVPLVDDIASVALDLWADEQGYRRLRANLLRTTRAAIR